MTRIGFLGLGAIGLPIARRLAAGSEPIAVYDPRAEAMHAMPERVLRAESPRDVGNHADIVFSCLASHDAYREAIAGPSGLVHGTAVRLHVHLGTTGPALVRELGDVLQARAVATIDAPITGGVGRAVRGELTSIVACPADLLEQVRPLIARYSSETVWMGERIGSAQVMKLVNNAVSLANLAAASEALVLGAKAGLDPVRMVQVLNIGSGQNSATLSKIPRDVLTGNFAFGGALRIVLKDMCAYLDVAAELALPSPVARTVLSCYEAAAAADSADADVTTVIRPMEAAADVSVRGPR